METNRFGTSRSGPSWCRVKRPNGARSLEEFVINNDSLNASRPPVVVGTAQVSIINDTPTIEELHQRLDSLDLMNAERLRPGWDTYFMVRRGFGDVPLYWNMRI